MYIQTKNIIYNFRVHNNLLSNFNFKCGESYILFSILYLNPETIFIMHILLKKNSSIS